MTPAARKTLWWYVLGACLGGTLFFFYICILESFPSVSEIHVYLWPLASTLGLVAAIFMLRRCYRDEPDAFSGFWQLAIVDLYAIIIFCAIWMAAWQSISRDNFVPAGIAAALFMGLCFTICLLISARKGFHASRLKIPFALGLLLKTMGWLSIGAIGLLSSYYVVVGDFGKLSNVWAYCIFFSETGGHYLHSLWPVQLGMFVFPVGMLLCWAIEKRARVLP